MGNTPSNLATTETEDIWWKNGENHETTTSFVAENNSNKHEFSLEEFDRKRAQRKAILEAKRQEIQQIRDELSRLSQENGELRKVSTHIQENRHDELELLQKENDRLKEELRQMKNNEVQMNNLMEKNKELRISVSEMQSELQILNSSVLDFEQQKQDYKRHVLALKDVVKVSKELILIRENELTALKEKLKRIELEFNEREASLMSNELKREYERQLANIRILRDLYEERTRTHRRETSILKSNISDKDKEIEENKQKISELEERVNQLDKENSDKYDSIKLLESNLGLAKAETRQCEAELSVINQLFSNILLAFNNSPDLDLDKLLKQLEAHHGLLKDIVNNEISGEVSSALPKVLLDLVNQISSEKDNSLSKETCEVEKPPLAVDGNEINSTNQHNLNSPAEIVENLPKVWRVLIELLSHQCGTNSEQGDESDTNLCFKTVSTPKGPSHVLSVSKTFFRLKELIIEKKALEKDMNNLKQLNSHLENRLQEQEKRFGFVSTELTKTWSFVEKLQKEHHLLHTQEQILRYELAQKRKLLKELKEELQYSRDKWQQAREKNSKTEKEWLILRKEFAARRKTPVNDDGNNSVESGYSDEREELSDEEPGYETDISECNLKADEMCEDDIETSTILKDLTCDTEDQNGKSSSVPEDEQTEMNENNACSNTSILDVIQNEITEIAKKLPPDSTLNDNEPSSSNKEIKEIETITRKNYTKISEDKEGENKINHGHTSKALDVIQNEITEIVQELPPDSILNDNQPSSSAKEFKEIETTTEKNYCKISEDEEGGNEINNDHTSKALDVTPNEITEIAKELPPDSMLSGEGSSSAANQSKEIDITKFKDNSKTTENQGEKEINNGQTSRAALSNMSLEERLAARDERLKRLEGQCKALVSQVTTTSHKSAAIYNKLEDLHEIYGESSRIVQNSEDTNTDQNTEISHETMKNEDNQNENGKT